MPENVVTFGADAQVAAQQHFALDAARGAGWCSDDVRVLAAGSGQQSAVVMYA